MRLEFFVPGDAKSSGSKTPFAYTDKNTAQQKIAVAPANKKQKSWQAKVSWYAIQVKPPTPLDEPVILRCVFYRERPGYHYVTQLGRPTRVVKPRFEQAKPTSKPDSLKLARAVEDAMSGVIYRDDSLVCDHYISKRYCNPGQTPGVEITVETYDERKNVTHGKEETTNSGTESLFGGPGRADSDDGGDQSTHPGAAQGQDQLHGAVAER